MNDRSDDEAAPRVATGNTALRTAPQDVAELEALAGFGSWTLDPSTGTMSWSEQLYRLLDYQPRTVVPTLDHLARRMHPDDARRLHEELRSEVSRPPHRDLAIGRFRLIAPNGQERVVRAHMRLYARERGTAERVTGVFQAVTKEEARETGDVARIQEMERFRAQFISKAAHELRTPLLPLRIHAHVLSSNLGPQANERVRRSLAELAVNLERMNRLVDELLDAARFQAGRIRLEKASFDLGTLLDELASNFEPVAHQLGLTFAWRKVDGAIVEADPQRIIQVVHNLLGNAMKFTPKGGFVTLQVLKDNTSAHIVVADSGEGFTAEEGNNLFEPFAQAKAGRTHSAKGAGLGLYISKGLVESHGGEIEASSPGPGQGATFKVRLPLGAKPAQPMPAGLTVAEWWRTVETEEPRRRLRELI